MVVLFCLRTFLLILLCNADCGFDFKCVFVVGFDLVFALPVLCGACWVAFGFAWFVGHCIVDFPLA